MVSTEMFMSWVWGVVGVGVREKGEAGGENTMGVAMVGGGREAGWGWTLHCPGNCCCR